jgi:hypothetical protein
MQQVANCFFAVHVVSFQSIDGAHHFWRSFNHLWKQQVGFFGMMQLFRKFIDVKKHGAHDFKKLLCVFKGPAFNQLSHGMQHGCK